jgi:glycosyltransferase involved in cell wall biosynthesis
MFDQKKNGATTVLHVGPDAHAKGGIASVIHGYAENEGLFRSHNCNVTFAATCGGTGLRRLMQFLSAWLHIVKGALLRDVDLVHIHTSVRGSLLRKWLLAATCVVLRQRFVLHIHNGAFENYFLSLPAWCRVLVKTVWQRSAQIICLSRNMQSWLVERWHCDVEQCPLVYNGIRDPLQGDGFHRTSERVTTILFLGRLVEGKGVTTLLSAVQQLKRRNVPFELLVAGDGEVDAFLAEVEQRDLRDSVTYLGWVVGDEKTALLASADIFVLPSRSEGFPVAIIEAMAFGAAIVSTHIPGVVDAINEGREGLLVQPDDPDALSNALASLIANPVLRAELSFAARRRFLDHFTIQRTVEQLVLAYEQAQR